MTPGTARFRDAMAGDAHAIAALHASSWRAHYRGAASDAYLDGPIEAERQAFWARRLESSPAGQIVVVGETGQGLVGFTCAFASEDERWGSLIDNLHVAKDLKGQGLGRALMREVALRLREQAPEPQVHLYALAANDAARAFYERLGGAAAGEDWHPLPDGSDNLVIRYAWTSPDHLAQCAGGDVP